MRYPWRSSFNTYPQCGQARVELYFCFFVQVPIYVDRETPDNDTRDYIEEWQR